MVMFGLNQQVNLIKMLDLKSIFNKYIYIYIIFIIHIKNYIVIAYTLKVVEIGDRQTISRVRNVLLALSYYKMLIYDTSIQYALEESKKYTVSV